MPSKLQFYSAFAERTARQITGSYRSWTAFLATFISIPITSSL